MDNIFIIALVLFGIGAVLLLIGAIKLCMWLCRARETSKEEKKKIKALEHIRYLEEYSIRTGGSARSTPRSTPKSTRSGSDSVFRYDDLAGVNPAYITENSNGIPRTYLKVTHSSNDSTGRKSPVGSLGHDPDMPGMSGAAVAHPSDQYGVARVMVGGTGARAVSPSPMSPLPMIITTTEVPRGQVPMETGSQYSTVDRRQYADVMF